MTKSKLNRLKVGDMGLMGVVYVVMCLYVLSLVIPIIWIFLSSFKGSYDLMDHPFGWPQQFKWSNYPEAFNSLRYEVQTPDGGSRYVYMPEMYWNTLVFALSTAFMSTLAPCITAYAVAKYRFKVGRIIYGTAIVTMILPIVGGLPSELNLVHSLGIFDNIVGMMIMKFTPLGFNFLIFYASFKGISWEYAEAAFMDGASHLGVQFRVMLPLAAGTFSTLFLLSFTGCWKDYYTPMLYLPSMPTISYGLWLFQYDNQSPAGSSVTIQLAACITSSIPLVLMFVLFKNKLMGNITMGGIKG